MTVKIKPGFEVRDVCGEYIVMAIGERNLDFTNMILLNATSFLVWKQLENGPKSDEELTNAILKEYEIDYETAMQDVKNLCLQLQEIGALECFE